MARIRALDTTHEWGSLALVEDGKVIEETLLHSPGGFGHVLFSQAGALLERNGWTLETVGCFAAAAGPGPFTGVRVGLAAAKGLGAALGKPVAGVSNLKAIALCGEAPLRAVAIEARRGEIYGAVYSASLEIVVSETVAPLTGWLEQLPAGPMEFICLEPGALRRAIAGGRFADTPVRQAPRALAGAVGRIAARLLARGSAPGAEAVEANYVRRPDAELYWRET